MTILASKDDCSATDFVSESSASDSIECPKDMKAGTFLKSIYFVLNNGFVFEDKLLPEPSISLLSENIKFSTKYYIDLYSKVKSFYTYNHLGARIPLEHCNINVNKFRALLPEDYDDRVVLQYLEFGFPLGLQEDFVLQPVSKNHFSSYEFYSHVDHVI